MASLSIIIPCANDAESLAECLGRLANSGAEIVVADASKDDSCAAIANTAGAKLVRCAVRGRGQQLNAGAAVASGEILVFNHCDTQLLPQHLQAIREVVTANDPAVLAGAFYKDLAHHYPKFAWAESFVKWWSGEHSIIYGDQTMWFRREHFLKLGGFPDIPIMEDIVMSDKMREAGGVALLEPPLRTSMRRFKQRGSLRTRVENFLVILLFRCGLSPARIYRWYYGRHS